MPLYTLNQAAIIVNGEIHGDNSLYFSRLATDSRTVYSAENLLFIALKGDRHDGHRFVNELYTRRHVKLFLVSEWHTDWESFTDASFLSGYTIAVAKVLFIPQLQHTYILIDTNNIISVIILYS